MSDESSAEDGGLVAWAGVAFFCTLLLWVPAAAVASASAGKLASLTGTAGVAHPRFGAFELAAVVLTQLFACFGSVVGAAFVVGRFGPPRSERAAYLGVTAIVVGALVLAGVQQPLPAVGAAVLLLPLAFGGVSVGLRVGRHKRAKGI